MRSLQQRLLIGLGAGLAVLWAILGVAVYVPVRKSMEGRFDAELKALASEIRYLLPEGRHLRMPDPPLHWLDFFRPDSGLYFEVWDEHLLFSDRSPSLGVHTLPRPALFSESAVTENAVLASGEKVRVVKQGFFISETMEWGVEVRHAILVVVARNRDELSRNLLLVLAAVGLVGMMIIPASFLLVRVSVARGLKPLRGFANQASRFRYDVPGGRFDARGLPLELVPIARRLNDFLAAIEDGLARERRLNADLAHELRTPVAELRTMAEVALAWPEQADPERFRDVLASALQMQRVIGGMLMLARHEGGREKPEMRRMALRDAVSRCLVEREAMIRNRKIDVHVNIPDEAAIKTNPELFHVLAGNLIANAVEYCPEGERVVVEGGGGEIDGWLTCANPAPGLTREDVARLFDRFWRKDAARSGSGHAGLGLALAKSCASLLDLELTAERVEDPPVIMFRVCVRK